VVVMQTNSFNTGSDARMPVRIQVSNFGGKSYRSSRVCQFLLVL
jgi:hypothetical protein